MDGALSFQAEEMKKFRRNIGVNALTPREEAQMV